MDISNLTYYEKAALHSRYNAKHWFRYLRKIVNEDGCVLSGEEVQELIDSPVLTMFQKVTLKRAVVQGSPTNLSVIALNKRSTTPMVNEVRRKIFNDRKCLG